MTISVGSNKTVVLNASSNTKTTIDFTGTGGNLELTNLSPTHKIALSITGSFGSGISNVLTFTNADNISTSSSEITYSSETGKTVITLINNKGRSLGTITASGDIYNLAGNTHHHGHHHHGHHHHHNNTVTVSESLNYISSTNANGEVTVCFLADSMIATPKGAMAVQDLHAGDEVLTYVGGEARTSTLSWAGMAHCTVNPALPDDMAGYPVRILANAIADDVPYKDMLLTAEHCLFFDGAFIPARMLVNGVSVFYDKSITSYTYYHIETPDHAVIMADGMLTESYLDTGNRRSFTQKGNVIQLGGAAKSWQADAAAPLCVERERVEAVFRQISARMGANWAAPATVQNPELRLVTNTGATIWPANCKNDTYNFMLPANTQAVHLASRASRPADVIGPFVDDRRQMGVAVAEINLLSAAKHQAITAHLQAEKPEGWHATDWTDCAWTNGNAALPLPAQHTQGAICMLSVKIRAAGPYLADDTAQDVAAKTA
ncbi:Hint domain-containing protein [Acetobacter sp. A11-2]|uniref:Hint domain-containing protein n=1 Tax=Acetobacter sp. A11-2 TaxID=3157859 RepID=UPI0032EFEA0F